MVGIISVVIGGHFGGGDHFDGGDHFGGGTTSRFKATAFCLNFGVIKNRIRFFPKMLYLL